MHTLLIVIKVSTVAALSLSKCCRECGGLNVPWSAAASADCFTSERPCKKTHHLQWKYELPCNRSFPIHCFHRCSTGPNLLLNYSTIHTVSIIHDICVFTSNFSSCPCCEWVRRNYRTVEEIFGIFFTCFIKCYLLCVNCFQIMIEQWHAYL